MTRAQTSENTAPNSLGVYWVWLTGVAVTMLGTQALAFGLVWYAAASSAALASMVSFAVVAPRVALSLFGGGISDRFGPGRVMIACDAVMATLIGAAALAVLQGVAEIVIILACALALGIADAFYLPASGSMPKFLVAESQIPRAMAARQLVAQGSAFVGPALGGIVAAAGLVLSLTAGSIGFLAMLAVLLMIRRHIPMTAVAGAAKESLLTSARTAASTAFRVPTLRVAVTLTGGFSLFILPLTSLLIPLVGQASSWTATMTGIVMGCYGGGMALVSIVVLARSAAERAGIVASIGVLLGGVGTLGISLSENILVVGTSGALAGIGAGLFATHLGPMFIKSAPRERMASLQAVLILAQNLPLLLAAPLIGALATSVGAVETILIWAVGSLLLGLCALLSRPVRTVGL